MLAINTCRNDFGETMLSIPQSLLEKMVAHLEAGYPYEACGILIGDIEFGSGEATKIVKDVAPVANVWDVENERESQRNRYLIAPDEFVHIEREASKRGLDIVGFFHSHPDHPSQPSETDREFAWPVVSFVIVSVRYGKAATTQSWLLHDERDGFEEEPVQIVT